MTTPLDPYASAFDPKKPTSQLDSLFRAGLARRNIGLQTLLGELNKPSYQNLYATPGVDAAARGYISRMESNKGALAQRGLMGSGLQNILSRDALTELASNVMGAESGAASQETARRQNLLDLLTQMGGQDVNFLSQIAQGQTAGYNTETLNKLRLMDRDYGQAVGGTGQILKTLAAIAAGGFAAAGAGAAAGGAGGATGAGVGASGGTIAATGGQAAALGPSANLLSQYGGSWAANPFLQKFTTGMDAYGAVSNAFPQPPRRSEAPY